MAAAPPTTLLVNSNSDARKSQAAILRELGYKDILTADCGNDAWSIIQQFEVQFIVSTWHLREDMSGLGLLKIVRSDPKFAQIPFLMLVYEATRQGVLEAAAAGVSGIIVMPFSRDAFQKKIINIMSGDRDPKQEKSKKVMELGIKSMKAGQYQEALSHFKRVITITENAEVYYNIGYIKTAQGKYEEAIAAFKKATELDRTFAQAYQMMGEAYMKMGRKEEAKDCFNKAANIYLEKQLDQKAEAAFLKVLEVNPNTPNVYNSLGIVYRRQGRFEDSVKMYLKALKVNPFDEHIYYNLARGYLGYRRFPEAAKALKNAIHINPEFAEAANLLKSIEMGSGT